MREISEPIVFLVAPYAGAWIETVRVGNDSVYTKSHPMRVRGLKPMGVHLFLDCKVSHPMRVRGLKLDMEV